MKGGWDGTASADCVLVHACAYRKRVPPKRSFDADLAALEQLRDTTPETASIALGRALGHSNNFLVAKAATLAQHHWLTSLTSELVAAFEKFRKAGAKGDPQCWAKHALAKTLAAFEYQESSLFLAGMRHVQLEPGWGGSTDSAGALRGTCALALVQCRELSSHRVLMALTPLFADKDLPVQVNAARAVEQVGGDAAALLLRLRAELGSGEPELLGACFAGVLALEGPGAVGWAARFLGSEDDAAAEAAMAIAQTRTSEAFTVLRRAWEGVRDPWFRGALLTAISLVRTDEATHWLIELASGEGRYAGAAHEAICRSALPEAVLERLRQVGKPCP